MTNSRTHSRVRRLAASALLATLAVAFTGCSGNDDMDAAGGDAGGTSSDLAEFEGDAPANASHGL